MILRNVDFSLSTVETAHDLIYNTLQMGPVWRLFRHSLREKTVTRGKTMKIVRSCSTWDIYLGLSLRESIEGASIKIVLIMIRQNNN